MNKLKVILISLLMVSTVNASTLDDVEDFVMNHKVLTIVGGVIAIQIAEPLVVSGLIGLVGGPLFSALAPEALGEVGLLTLEGFSESALAEASTVTAQTLGEEIVGSEIMMELDTIEPILEL